MDLNDIWQENKRFITGVVGGAVVFLFGLLLIQSLYGDELASTRRSKSRLERQLSESRYGTDERELARADNEALEAALAELAEAVEFVPRADFRASASEGSPWMEAPLADRSRAGKRTAGMRTESPLRLSGNDLERTHVAVGRGRALGER